jgi:hypothetical protein
MTTNRNVTKIIFHILLILSGPRSRYDHPCRLVSLQNKETTFVVENLVFWLLNVFAISTTKNLTLSNIPYGTLSQIAHNVNRSTF